MADVSIAWKDGDWVAASDRVLEFGNRLEQSEWTEPCWRPWLRKSVKMQTWENEPWCAKRDPPYNFERVNGSMSQVWWLRERDTERLEDMVFDLPFLIQHYFQNYLFLSAEACVYDFVQNYKGTYPKELCSMRDKKRDTVEIEKWTKLLKLVDLPKDEYSAFRREILDAVKLLRHKAIHRQRFQIDALWYSMKLPELLNDWNRAFEIQQVFQYVLEDPHMEMGTRETVEKLFFGPKMPPATLLQAHSWLQHSLEELCFRFVQRNYPKMLKDREWEWPEQGELEENWEYALVQIPSYDHSLDSNRCPNDESQLFSHQRLRRDVLLQGRKLRDATSHRDGLNETFLRKYALNGILLAIMVGDREQAIDIEATMEAFLTGKTKYQVLTRLRAACTLATPIPMGDLGEKRKHETLATYLGDKEVYVSEAKNQLPSQSATEDLADTYFEHPSLKPEPDHCPTEQPDSCSTEDDGSGRPFSETILWEIAIGSFVFGNSMHEAFQPLRRY